VEVAICKDRYPIDFYTPQPPTYVNTEKLPVGCKLFGFWVFPQLTVWGPAWKLP
jgi:hypothetical protein